MTFNATLSSLHEGGRLRLWRPHNSGSGTRYIFLTLLVEKWINNLPKDAGKPGKRRNKLPPYDQVAGLFDSFTSGESLSRLSLSGMEPPFLKLKRRKVGGLCVWEARLSDTRVFLWCIEPGVIVAVQGRDTASLKSAPENGPQSYEAYARSVARWRHACGFKNAHIWAGEDLDAFLTPPGVSPI